MEKVFWSGEGFEPSHIYHVPEPKSDALVHSANPTDGQSFENGKGLSSQSGIIVGPIHYIRLGTSPSRVYADGPKPSRVYEGCQKPRVTESSPASRGVTRPRTP